MVLKIKVISVLVLLSAGVGLGSAFAFRQDVDKAVPFDIEGEYTWACSCDVVCPCAFGSPNTTEDCHFPMAYHIVRGRYGDLDLSGLNVIWMSLEGPRPLIQTFMEGRAVGALLIDERASEDQQRALVDVLTRIRGRFYRKIFPPRVVQIQYQAEGEQRIVRVPGLLDLRLDLVRHNGKPIEIINAPYWVPRFFAGRAIKHEYTDDALGYQWDLKGKYGDYAGFHWTDKSDLYKGLLETWRKNHPEEPEKSGVIPVSMGTPDEPVTGMACGSTASNCCSGKAQTEEGDGHGPH